MTILHPTWQKALTNAITDFGDLCRLLSLDGQTMQFSQAAEQSFALRVPREFVSRMTIGNPKDPLLLQILPQPIEMQTISGFFNDPLNEQLTNPVPGLLHKYHGRVLLTLTGACAINCRYCFRRHFPYAANLPSKENWIRILDYIRQEHSIDEVILSGGDPLVLKDNLLASFVSTLEEISHLKRLRIHTRLPIVIPQRITDEFVVWLSRTRLQTVIVLHCNHPNEIDESVIQVLGKLRKANIVLLNQFVLLKNINDNVPALVNLSKKLFETGVLPYYVYLLDKVNGAAHFDVSETCAHELIAEMKKQLPGFLVPKLAREVPGMAHKVY